MSFVVAGLGNPGDEYVLSRHNAGRIVLEQVSRGHMWDEWEFKVKLNALVTNGKIGKENITLLLPETMMNRSGKALAPLVSSVKKAHKLIIVYDDIDLPFGYFKITFNRSSGGHRGLESVIKQIRTKEFIRIRIGVSPVTPSGKLKKPNGEDAVLKFLLDNFKPKELEILKKKIAKKVGEAIELIITKNYEHAMTKFN